MPALKRSLARQSSAPIAWIALTLAFLLAALVSAPSASGIRSPEPSAPSDVAIPAPVPPSFYAIVLGMLSNDGLWVVRAYFQDRSMVDELAAWREPWEVHHDQGYLVLDVSRTDVSRLLSAGFRLEIDWATTAQMNLSAAAAPENQVAGIPGRPCYRTVEETYAAAAAIEADHPNLAAWIDIGDTWEKIQPGGAAGYDMMVLRLTNSEIVGPKPKLFALGAIHARELATAELLTRFAENLVANYGTDADVTWLLDHHEFHLLLQGNPDGRKWAEASDYWRKNTDNDYCANSDMRGVDLNRNFGYAWGCCGGSSADECDETFRGPAAASEPETQAIQEYVRAVFPDQREDDLYSSVPITASHVFLDIHSYGGLLLWPWGFTESPAPDSTALQTLGRKLAFLNGYTPTPAHALYLADGTTDDFAYGELGLAAYTIEVGTQFFQDCATFEGTIWPDNLLALEFAAKVARTPFLTPAGPDALDVAIMPDTSLSGRAVHLTATIDDARYSDQVGTEPTQNIVAAEFYVDVPPWVSGDPAQRGSMEAQDGAFDESTEQVAAAISTVGWGQGQHIIFVRGQDAAGNWGAFSAALFEIESEAVSWSYLPFIAGD